MGSTTKRIVFPSSFPVIEKTIRMDLDMSALQAVNLISEKSRCDCSECYLFLPAAKRAVGDEELLMDLEEWPNEEFVELRSKNQKYDNQGGGCCTVC